MTEVWNPIPGYVGLYEASSYGRIRSIDRVVSTYSARAGRIVPQSRRGRVLAQNIGPHGYLLVSLSMDGKAAPKRVNRLVCSAFHGEKSESFFACHNDGDQRNNRARNLRWGTPAENQADRVEHGTALHGEGIATARLSEADVATIHASRTYGSLRGVTVSRTHYYRIKKGEAWAHLTETIRGGFHEAANDRSAA